MSEFQYSTLDTTIRRALLADEAENKAPYVRAFVHARRWYENDYVGAVEKAYGHRTVQLLVETDRTAALPADYVDYSMIGLRAGEQVRNLLHNPALVPLPLGESANSLVAQAQAQAQALAGPYQYTYTNWLENTGVDYCVGYGYPAVRAGEFTVQRAERQLLLSSQVSPGAVLLLDYLSDDAPVGGQTLIHPQAESWLEFYLLDHLNRRRNPTLAAGYRADAENASRLYLQKRSPFQLEDVYAAMRNVLARHP